MKEKIPFCESKTMENLARSFAGECMEGAKYQFVAKQCELQQLAYLKSTMKTLAKHEMAHAKVFWDLLHENCGNKIINNINLDFGYPFDCTNFCENFNCAKENIYPEFAKIAKDEGYPEIERAFKLIATVENSHSLLLAQIYEKCKGNKFYKSPTSIKWKCNQCGFEHNGKTPPSPCPLCEMAKGYYEIKFDTGE